MGRLAISAGIAAALVVTAVAVGAGGDVRIHRLHLPPPPGGDDAGGVQPPAPTDPSAPPSTSPPTSVPPPAGGQPPAPPPPTSSVGCTVAGDAPGATVTGTLSDYAIALSAASVSAAATLQFRGTYPVGADVHNLTLRDGTGNDLCGTATFGAGNAGTFTVTNLPSGSYQLVCTIHAAFGMTRAFTVN
ncbi:MAG TPA: hypothetical protein VFD90_17760 [Gaiellales bacterium]|jgi:plastocyanin|nr:hypothetical protein [Gaiellales bacterium]